MLYSEQTQWKVGAGVSLLLAIGVLFSLNLEFRKLGPSIQIQLYFRHPGPLKGRADVQLGGRVVGRVASIRIVTAREADDPTHPLYPEGGVLAVVKLKRKYLSWIDRNSQFFVSSKGIIGESYIEVVPPPRGVSLSGAVQDRDEVRGIDPARMEEVIVTGFLNTRRFAALAKELRPDVELLSQEWTQLALLRDEFMAEASRSSQQIRSLRTELTALVDAWTQDELSLAQTFSAARRLVSQAKIKRVRFQSDWTQVRKDLLRISAHLDDPRLQELVTTIDRAEADLARLQAAATTLQRVSSQVSQGIGTVGALIRDPEFSDDAKKLGRYLKRHPWELLDRPILSDE